MLRSCAAVAQCMWQPPPQHPPPDGGPIRLTSAGAAPLLPPAGGAVTDIRRSSFRAPQVGQATLVPPRTSCWNSVSQAEQR